ncbi:hypothetical protein A2U01_0015262 [Trifolium medium]|uniref:Uncharacterized protein n=1 Tax=Trifolium medium TaxID=97028 RepID=A0A392N732_9FABA|nr:hypothetical protein [Trifolium medium]
MPKVEIPFSNLAEKFGDLRVLDNSNAENAFTDMGVGAAMTGHWTVQNTDHHLWARWSRIATWSRTLEAAGVIFSINLWYSYGGVLNTLRYQGLDETAIQNVDWAGSPSNRRSTSEYCVLIGGNMISRRSKKQNIVALSSAGAEYCAMAAASKELAWLRNLLI